MAALIPAPAYEERSMITFLNAEHSADRNSSSAVSGVWPRLESLHICCRSSAGRCLIIIHPQFGTRAQWFDEVINSPGPGVGSLSRQLELVSRRSRIWCAEFSCAWMQEHDIFNIRSEESLKDRPLSVINPYSAKGLGDRLYATLHKLPGEVGHSFCLFLKSKNSPLYTSGSHFIHSTAGSNPSLLNHIRIYYKLLQK